MDFQYCGSTTSKLVDCILADLGQVGEAIRSHLSKGEFEAALSVPFPSVDDSQDPSAFAESYLAYNLLRKNTFIDIGLDREAAALLGFYESEASCAYYNRNG